MKVGNVVLVFVGIVFALLMGGCATVEPGHYENLTAAVNSSIDATELAAGEIIEAIKVSGVVDKDKVVEIEESTSKVSAKMDIVQQGLAEAAKVYDEKAQEDKFAALIEASQAANNATLPLNPYAPIIGVLLAAVGGGYGAIKKKESAVLDKKYTAHKHAVEGIFRASAPQASQDLYNTIGDERKKLGL